MVQVGRLSMLEYLLQNGAQMGHCDPYGRTALHYSIAFSRNEVAKLLIRKGADRCAQLALHRTLAESTTSRAPIA